MVVVPDLANLLCSPHGRSADLESVRRDALALSQHDRELLTLNLHDRMEKDPGYDEK